MSSSESSASKVEVVNQQPAKKLIIPIAGGKEMSIRFVYDNGNWIASLPDASMVEIAKDLAKMFGEDGFRLDADKPLEMRDA